MSEVIFGHLPACVPLGGELGDDHSGGSGLQPLGGPDEQMLIAATPAYSAPLDDLDLPRFEREDFCDFGGLPVGLSLAALRSANAARHQDDLTHAARERHFAPVDYALQLGVPTSMVRLDGWQRQGVLDCLNFASLLTSQQTWLATAVETQAPWSLADQGAFRETGPARSHRWTRSAWLRLESSCRCCWRMGIRSPAIVAHRGGDNPSYSTDPADRDAFYEALGTRTSAWRLGNTVAWAAVSMVADGIDSLGQAILLGPWCACLRDIAPGEAWPWNEVALGRAADSARGFVNGVGREHLAVAGRCLVEQPQSPSERVQRAIAEFFFDVLCTDDGPGLYGLLGQTFAGVYGVVRQLDSIAVAEAAANAAVRSILGSVAGEVGDGALARNLEQSSTAVFVHAVDAARPSARRRWVPGLRARRPPFSTGGTG